LAENAYEGMYILDSNRYGRDPDAVSGQIREMIEGIGGKILVSRVWEERRLAYPIRGQRKGTYWLTYSWLDGKRLPEIERKCQLNDNILRALFLKIDPRIIDALVAHAQAEPAAPGAEEKDEAAKDEKEPRKRGEKSPVAAAKESGGSEAEAKDK